MWRTMDLSSEIIEKNSGEDNKKDIHEQELSVQQVPVD